MAKTKVQRRAKIRRGIRGKIEGNTGRPRLSVFRSNKDIYAQTIDDSKGMTICSASSRDKGIADSKENKVNLASVVGKKLAEKAIAAGVSAVVFDRGGYLYHGRVKSLAEGAREGGLQF
jgi:large subunit ribosomal protein L18